MWLQWGLNYVVVLIELSLEDILCIEKVMVQLFVEVGKDFGVFYECSECLLKKVVMLLFVWNYSLVQVVVVGCFKVQFDGVCGKFDGFDVKVWLVCESLMKLGCKV